MRGSQRTESLLGRFTAVSSEMANARGIYLGRRATKFHVALYRRTGGRLGGHVPGWPDARIVLVEHTGSKTGKRRTSPLMFHQDGEAITVAASKAGQPTHPAWFHNLKANPDTTIQIGSTVRRVRARIASDAERERLWPEFVAFYPGMRPSSAMRRTGRSRSSCLSLASVEASCKGLDRRLEIVSTVVT